jgi:exopolyphosphatase/guanosine-5'-triphosphate,3'-diphosphate pyrophosphatase
MRTAIIDMGTNTFHLLIAEVDQKGFRFLHEQREATRIGAGGINDGRITDEAIGRALNTLQKFKKVILEYEVASTMAFGTSAVRNATNANEFVQQIHTITGIQTKIISGEEEASLIYEGIRLAMDVGEEDSLIMDIGGGSVEFIIGNKNEIRWKQSFEIGGQRLLDKFKPQDPILAEEINLISQYFQEKLVSLFEAIKTFNPRTLVGSSGSFDTFSEIHCLKNGMIYPKTPETPLTFESFDQIHQELISKTRKQRMQIPGMIALRVDMIVVASCLVKFLLERNQFKKIRVSSFSLKEGVLSRMMSI